MTVLSTVEWDVDVLARSSIVHQDNYGSVGTDVFGLFRREKIRTADGQLVQVPVVSGNSFRGVLRRIGEQLTAEVLNYEGTLPTPAAHLLTNGGRLAKTKTPLTDEQERELKDLLPQVAVFGGAVSGRIISGLLQVAPVYPEFVELAGILPRTPQGPLVPAVLGMAEESFTHLDDHRPIHGAPPRSDHDETTSPLGRYAVETLPAGTRLQTGAVITDATDIEIAFLRDVFTRFSEHGHLGGRTAAGHGRVSATVTARVERGHLPGSGVDWAKKMARQRRKAIAALARLS